MSRLAVGVIGCGYWGPNLVRNLSGNPLVELRYVCDLSPERLTAMKISYPTVRITQQYGQLLNDKDLAAVVIATPIHTHYSLARMALLADKHVFIEKPMCTSADECLDLTAIAERKGLTLMVGHTFVYHGAVRRIKKEIESGSLGDIVYFDSRRVNLGLSQPGHNVIFDLASHDIAITDYLFGASPISISATGAALLHGEIEDIAYVTMKFHIKMIAHLNVSWISPVKVRQILIGGTRKMLVYDDLQPVEKIRIYDKGVSIIDSSFDPIQAQSSTRYRAGEVEVVPHDLTEALKVEIAHFVECVRTGNRPDTDGWAGCRIVRILQTANESLKTATAHGLAKETRFVGADF